MDAPQIQYCKTVDDVRIAFASAGSGSPIVVARGPGSHVRLDWQNEPALRLAAQAFHLVWYDSRGSGLADRSTADFSLDSMLSDLGAVVDAAQLDSFALVATGDAGPVAVAYAAQNQARVTRLILINAWVKATDYQQTVAYQIEEALRTKSPDAWIAAVAPLIFPDSPEDARRWAEETSERMEPSAMIAAQRTMEGWNAEPFLSSIIAPTMVIANPASRWTPPRVAERVAARIADCRLVFEDPRSSRLGPLIGAFILGAPMETSATAAEAEPTAAASKGEREIVSGTAIILFADIVDSTALAERLGNAAFRERARALEQRVRERIAARAGAAVDGRTLGDGVLATFASASDAIAAAVECAQVGDDIGLALHLGLHAGDVMREGGNVHGQAVSIASRVSDLSAPNEVLVSGTVRDLARASAGVSFEDLGERELKGVGEPVRVFAVRGE